MRRQWFVKVVQEVTQTSSISEQFKQKKSILWHGGPLVPTGLTQNALYTTVIGSMSPSRTAPR